MRSERVDLKNVSIAMAESRIDRDREVVVEVLGKIAAKLPGDDRARRGVVTMDADVEMARVVEDAHFGIFRGRLGFVWLTLAEIGNEGSGGPEGIIESAIQARREFGPSGTRDS